MSRCSLILSMTWGVACAVIQAAEPPADESPNAYEQVVDNSAGCSTTRN